MDTSKILDELASAPRPEPDDYTEEGVMMCGKCHTPKQALKALPMPGGGTTTRLVRIVCKCEREKQEQERREFERDQFSFRMSGLREEYGITDRSYLKFTFEKDDRREVKISDICRRYVNRWEEMKTDNIGMLFYGTVGTGKSFSASAVVNALLYNCVTAAVTSFPRLLNILQSTRDRQECIDHLQRYQLLVIDDLGVERDSSYAAEQVYNVIDARVNSGLPLIVTTNLTLDELKNPPTMQYARIYDRVLELCPVQIKMTGESRRTGNAEVRKEKARELLA